jgi:hypothetical protein
MKGAVLFLTTWFVLAGLVALYWPRTQPPPRALSTLPE